MLYLLKYFSNSIRQNIINYLLKQDVLRNNRNSVTNSTSEEKMGKHYGAYYLILRFLRDVAYL